MRTLKHSWVLPWATHSPPGREACRSCLLEGGCLFHSLWPPDSWQQTVIRICPGQISFNYSISGCSLLQGLQRQQKIGWSQLMIMLYYVRLPGGSDHKEPACTEGDLGSIPGLGRSPGEGAATHSRILAWRIPWTEELGRLQSMGSQRVRHDWAAFTSLTLCHTIDIIFTMQETSWDFPGGIVVKNTPSKARDPGSITGQGTKIPPALGQLSPVAITREPMLHI